MNGGDEQVSVKFGGDTGALDSASKRAVVDIESVGDSATHASTKFKGMGDVIQGVLKGLTGRFTSIVGHDLEHVAEHAETTGSRISVAMASARKGFTGLTQSTGGIAASLEGLEAAAGALELVMGALGPVGMIVGGTLIAVSGAAAVALVPVLELGEKMGEAAEKLEQLSQRLGIGAEQASGFAQVFKAAGISQEQFGASTARLERSMVMAANGGKQQAAAFAALGVNVKELKSPTEAILAVSDKFKEMDNGPKKTALAMQLMGRAGAQMIPVLNEGRSAIEEQIDTAKKYGAVQDEAFVEKGMQVREAFVQNEMAMKGVENTLMGALAPAITTTVTAFNSLFLKMIESYRAGGMVKTAVDFMVYVFKSLVEVVITVGATFIGLYNIVTGVVDILIAASYAVTGSFDEAGKWADNATTRFNKAAGAAQSWYNVSKKLWEEKPESKGHTPEAPGEMDLDVPGMGPKGPKAKGQMSGWQEEWTARQLAERQYLKDSTADELAFWQTKLSLTAQGSKDRLDVEKKMYELSKRLAQEDMSEYLAENSFKIELAKNNYQEQMRLENERLDKIKAAYGEDSKEYKRGLEEKTRMQMAYQQDMVRRQVEAIKSQETALVEFADRSHELDLINLESRRSHLDAMVSMGRTNDAQQIAALRQINADAEQEEIAHENRLFEIKNQSLLDQLEEEKALGLLSKDEQTKLNEEIEQLQEKHATALKLITARGAAETAKINDQAANQLQQKWEKRFSPIANSFGNFLTAMANRTATFGSAIKAVGDQMVSTLIGAGVKMLSNWASMELAKTGLTHAQTAVRATSDATAAATSAATRAVANVAQVMGNAAVAASAAFASTAAIPIIGPELAPEAAAAAYAATAAFAPLASAAGGYDIPRGVNPLVQTHAEEMILPARYANPLRDLLIGPRMSTLSQGVNAGVNPSNVRGGDSHFTYSPSYTGQDASLATMLARDGATMRRWINSQFRDGKLGGLGKS